MKKERPRAGVRKPIEKEEDEEDAKKEALNPALEEKADDKKDVKETGVVVSKANFTPQVNNLLANHYVSLVTTKNLLGGRKIDDGKEEEQRKKKIEYSVTSLLLNSNEIRDITGLANTLLWVLPKSNPNQLQWLNLSYNYLTKIDPEILNFPLLKSLSLHGNYISEIEEVKKLCKIATLQSLTLNGNPIEEIKGYRLYVLGMMYSKFETLKKLDSVIITKLEFDNVIVWNDNGGNSKRLRKLRIDNPKQPPAKEEDENAKNQPGPG